LKAIIMYLEAQKLPHKIVPSL